MKAQELRLGNWVNRKPTEKIPPLKLCKETLGLILKSDWYIDTLEPIPLTEEWLVKFGFGYRKHLDDWFIRIDSNEILIIKGGYVYLCYNNAKKRLLTSVKKTKVHSLQNLYFALNGEELTIKN